MSDGRIVPFTKNREVIYDLLTRAKRFHCPVTSCWDFEVEALEAARRRVKVDGQPLGVTACLVKATALLLAEHPRLNHHLFHGLFRKYEVAFDRIRCNLIVGRRGPQGERVLLPLIVEDADTLTPVQIQEQINHHRHAPLESLPQFAAIERVKRSPRWALRWFSYKVRSDHRYYQRFFGSYGLSSLGGKAATAHSLSTVANTGTAFLLGGIQDKPLVRRGELTVGPVLGVAVVADHYLLDGLDVLQAMRTLRRLLRDPARLGLPGEATS